MAYDSNFTGGVSIAIGDVDQDGQPEIITGPGPGGGPHIKIFSLDGQIFSLDGQLESEFMAYDSNFTGGVRVMSDDLDKDGQDEILAGIINF